LDAGLCTFEVVEAATRQVVTLATVGVDGSTGIAQGANEVNKLVGVPLEGVVVIIDEDGIRLTLMGHLEGLDNPVIARLAVTA
jgi:hypothetical protein